MPFSDARGFTMVELMITVAVLAILMTIGFPSFQGVMRSNRVATTNNELLGALALARSEGLRNAHGGGVCASADGSTCAGDWNDGLLVWADANGNGVLDGSETVLRYVKAARNIVVEGPASGVIAFDQRGRRRGATSQQLTLQSDECGDQLLRRTLSINASGQVVSAKGACS